MDRQTEVNGATGDEKQIWTSIWSSELPRKIQGFLWIVLHGILPSRVSLASGGIPLDKRCFRCDQGEETGLHATRICVVSREV